MNKKARISLIVLVAALLLLALTMPVQAKKGDGHDVNFQVAFTLTDVSEEPYTATGYYEMLYGETDYHGDVLFWWIARYGVQQGTMVLEDGNGLGSMSIRLYTYQIGPSDDCDGIAALGHFQILEAYSTGDYDLIGSGTATACNHLDGTADGTLEGWATPFWQDQ